MRKENFNHYVGNITPSDDTIFVFGSNYEGRHGAGSAKVAMRQFGAIYGQGRGIQGHAYGLITTDVKTHVRPSVDRDEIILYIKELYTVARNYSNYKFKIAYRNSLDKKTLCGYSGYELMDMFLNKSGEIPSNIWFSKEWWDNIEYVINNPL